MSNKARWIVLAVFAAALVLYLAAHFRAARGTSGSEAHELAPEFSLTDLSGQKLDLASHKGKVVLLDFWATWCKPCREEIPHFADLQNKYAAQGFQVIGISMDDSPEPVVEFYREFKMNYPVAVGDAKLGERYGGVLGLPVTFLIGRDGRIYHRHIGAMDVLVIEKEINTLLQAR